MQKFKTECLSTNWELDKYGLNVKGDSGSKEGKEGKHSLDYPFDIDGVGDSYQTQEGITPGLQVWVLSV